MVKQYVNLQTGEMIMSDKITYIQDGTDDSGAPMLCATLEGFVNLHESPAGFGITEELAAFDLGVNFGRENPSHRPIRSAPMGVEILVFGGTYYSDSSWGGEEGEHEGPSTACGKLALGGVIDWEGENSGGHDKFYHYKPTHWLPMPKGLTPNL